MECKNCDRSLQSENRFCAACGAKVIDHRLTLKHLVNEIAERFFNLDNTFIKTFLHLFRCPQKVIDGYIGGVRRRYLNPISYLGIALTLSGIFLFLLRKVFFDDIEFNSFGSGMNPEAAKKIMNTSVDFSTFIFLLFIPLVATMGWLLFNTKKYNLTEYTVTAVYALAHYSIFTFPISILICVVIPQYYTSTSLLFILLMALYVTYVLNCIHGRKVIKSILFLIMFAIGFFMLSLLLNGIFLLTGLLTLQDLVPQK